MMHEPTIQNGSGQRSGLRPSRRRFLAAGGLGAALVAPAVVGAGRGGAAINSDSGHAGSHHMGGLGTVGEIAPDEYFDPIAFLTTWNHAPLPGRIPDREGWDASQFYRETLRPDGSKLREYQFVAVDREIEIAPG